MNDRGDGHDDDAGVAVFDVIADEVGGDFVFLALFDEAFGGIGRFDEGLAAFKRGSEVVAGLADRGGPGIGFALGEGEFAGLPSVDDFLGGGDGGHGDGGAGFDFGDGRATDLEVSVVVEGA